MSHFRFRRLAIFAGLITLFGLLLMAYGNGWGVPRGTPGPSLTAAEPDAAKSEPAVARARQVVRMLDDIYKSAIVLITTHYVDEASDMPAGEAFKALFAMVKEKGWHEVRLVDASGDPVNEENLPQAGFEQAAIAKLKAGETYWEAVTERDGKRYLQAATAIPVVLQKCVMCHENYSKVGKDQPIGALAYVVPLSAWE